MKENLRAFDPCRDQVPAPCSAEPDEVIAWEQSQMFRSEFRAELDDVPSDSVTRDEVSRRLVISGDRLPYLENVYRALGRGGWLTPDWRQEFGGMGLTWREAAIASEELCLAGVPDAVYVNSIRNAGGLLLAAGTPAQKAKLLPRLARVECVAAILYSEKKHGSDLGNIEATARRSGDNWLLTGVKRYGVKVDAAHIAICAARTGGPGIGGITLFLLDLNQRGVTRTPMRSFNAEPFWEVDLQDAVAQDQDVLGGVNDGWAVLADGLSIERTGLDYSAKARVWFGQLLALLVSSPLEPAPDPELAVVANMIRAGRSLAWQSLAELAEGRDAYAACAVSKLINSDAAQSVARLWRRAAWSDAIGECGVEADRALGFGNAVLREAPGLSLSAGSTEMMLELIAADMGLGA